jgi:hypothetical protein
VRIERSGAIGRPLPEVYAFLADQSRVTEWREDLLASERLSPPGELDGARYRETLQTPLGSQTATVLISTQPPHRLSFEVLDGPLRPRGAIVLSESGSDTAVLYTVDVEPMFKVRTPIDDAALKFLTKSIERSLAKLKELLETG